MHHKCIMRLYDELLSSITNMISIFHMIFLTESRIFFQFLMSFMAYCIVNKNYEHLPFIIYGMEKD